MSNLRRNEVLHIGLPGRDGSVGHGLALGANPEASCSASDSPSAACSARAAAAGAAGMAWRDAVAAP